MNKKRLLYWIVLWVCIFVITNIIINKYHKDYYEIGKTYCWELKEDPFLSEKENHHYIYILDKKEEYVKYVYIDNPNNLDTSDIFNKNTYSKNIDILYPYYKKY